MVGNKIRVAAVGTAAAAVLLAVGGGVAAADRSMPVPAAPVQGPATGLTALTDLKDDSGLPGEPNYGDGSRDSRGTLRITDLRMGPEGLNPASPPMGWDTPLQLREDSERGVVGTWSKNVLPVNPQSGKADVGVLGTNRGEGGVLKVGFSRQYRVKIDRAIPPYYHVLAKGGTDYLAVMYSFEYAYQQVTHGDVAGIPWGELDPEAWHTATAEFVNELADKGVDIPQIE